MWIGNFGEFYHDAKMIFMIRTTYNYCPIIVMSYVDFNHYHFLKYNHYCNYMIIKMTVNYNYTISSHVKHSRPCLTNYKK
jgi:hypothetical protein